MKGYVPRNLEECFSELKKILTKEQLEEFKNQKEQDVVYNHLFVLGLWIRDKWGLWDGSRLAEYFDDIGVSHPHEMSCIILTSFHRHLNASVRAEEQIEHHERGARTHI